MGRCWRFGFAMGLEGDVSKNVFVAGDGQVHLKGLLCPIDEAFSVTQLAALAEPRISRPAVERQKLFLRDERVEY